MALLSFLHQTSWSGEKKDDSVKVEKKKLRGVWVEVHAFAKKKTKGRGSVYAWLFKGDKVQRQHTQTIDGEPVIGSGHTGTYKLDISGKVNAIDIVLKSPLDEDWKYLGIYRFEGEILKLCMNSDKRPTTFENKDGNRLYVLQRPPLRPKESDNGKKPDPTQTDSEIKTISEEFAKAMLVQKDLIRVKKLVAVPFIHGWGRPPKISSNMDDLKKHLDGQVAALQATYMGNLKIVEIQTYEEYRAGITNNPKQKELYDKLMKKNDRVVVGTMNSKEGVTARCWIFIAWPKSQIRVVGFEAIHFAPKTP